jgi:hypothetical protein
VCRRCCKVELGGTPKDVEAEAPAPVEADAVFVQAS